MYSHTLKTSLKRCAEIKIWWNANTNTWNGKFSPPQNIVVKGWTKSLGQSVTPYLKKIISLAQ